MAIVNTGNLSEVLSRLSSYTFWLISRIFFSLMLSSVPMAESTHFSMPYILSGWFLPIKSSFPSVDHQILCTPFCLKSSAPSAKVFASSPSEYSMFTQTIFFKNFSLSAKILLERLNITFWYLSISTLSKSITETIYIIGISDFVYTARWS